MIISIFEQFSQCFLINDYNYINAKYNEPEILQIKIDKSGNNKKKKIIKHNGKFSSKIDILELSKIADNALNSLYNDHKKIELGHMSSSERYFLHKYFENKNNIKCYSLGRNEIRHIVLEYIE